MPTRNSPFSRQLINTLFIQALFLLTIGLTFSNHSHSSSTTGNSTLPTVLLLGDSIGAGYGVEERYSWGTMLSGYYAKQGKQFINASISGETSAGGLSRLPALLEQHQPELVIIELGGNDGLRGYPIKTFKKNMEAIIELTQASNSQVYLLGMLIPPNYGQIYSRLFQAVYTDAATKYKLELLPFLLNNIARNKALMQADGIHPNKAAQKTLFDNVLSLLPNVTVALPSND